MDYRVKVPNDIVKLIRRLHPILKKRIRAALAVICNDPYCGKALKEELTGLRSYRIKRFRIISRAAKLYSATSIFVLRSTPNKSNYAETCCRNKGI